MPSRRIPLAGTSHFLLIFQQAALAVGICRLAAPLPAVAAPHADAFSLVKAALAAPARLGPVEIVTTITEATPDKPASVVRITVWRNDAMHWKLSGVTGRYVREHYMNGGEALDYYGRRNEYRRYHEDSPSVQPEFGPMNNVFKMAVAVMALGMSMKTSRLYAHPKVLPILFQGEPAYRVIWKRLPNNLRASLTSAVFRQSDGLLLKFSGMGQKGEISSMSSTYHASRTPFPAALFTFVPPAGARPMAASREDRPTRLP